jgi:D-alanyl-D-alanine carboxypeptidase (penicillin-binding protein 5/6)
VRRRRATLAAAVALVAAVATFAIANHAVTGTAGTPDPRGVSHRASVLDSRRLSGSHVPWPEQGQAALVLGDGRPAASPHEQPVAIASVAKVMTAYLVLRRDPLSGGQSGFTVIITAAEAQEETRDAAEGQSVAVVRAGERLTERQLLEASLIPSGNNIAQLLAARVAGSDRAFVTEMNAEARALGMHHTTYTDPSGLDAGTVSMAADQLRVFRQAARLATFRQIVAMPSVTLPIAGTLANTNPLIAEGYAGKTGSDSAAGGCLAFVTHTTVAGRQTTAIGVVLGQGQGGDTSEILAAAGDAAQRLIASVARREPVLRTPPVAAGSHTDVNATADTQESP